MTKDNVIQTQLNALLGSMNVALYQADTGEQCLVLSHEPVTSPVYLRMQSACLFAEAFHSVECDCRKQIENSLQTIAEHGGVFVYLFQEGRGAGLAKKMLAMSLEHKRGVSSEQAYKELGIPVDSRDYTFTMDVLKKHVITSGTKIILLGKNGRKRKAVEKAGFSVTKTLPV